MNDHPSDEEWVECSAESSRSENPLTLAGKAPLAKRNQVGLTQRQAILGTGCVILILVGVILGAALLHLLTPSPTVDSSATPPQGPSNEEVTEHFRSVMDAAWSAQLDAFPESAVTFGIKGYGGRLSDRSPAGYAERYAADVALMATLHSIPRVQLSAADALSYDLLLLDTKDRIEGYVLGDYLMPVSPLEGPQIELAQLASMVEISSPQDARDYVNLLAAMPTLLQQTIETMRLGIARQMTMPAVVMPDAAQQATEQSLLTPGESAFFSPFNNTHPSLIPPGVAAAALEIISNDVLPAFGELADFINDEYFPRARATIGASALPNGTAYYQYRVRLMTTSDKSIRAIHELGLTETHKLNVLMSAIASSYASDATLVQYTEYLATQNSTFAPTEDAFLAFVRDVAKRADAQLPKLFGRLPRCPYGVSPIPSIEAPTAPAAYYMQPDAECHRAGMYYVNTYDLHAVPLYLFQSTTLHESVPGHHLQLAIQQELPDLPPFRRYGGYNAFIEGWALYAESLGTEMGFYQTPLFQFGRYGDAALRSCRLVVDTGIHAYNWTRQQAIDYMVQNTPLALLDITREVNRYISLPGQALGYKLGESVIMGLRDVVKIQQGSAFDVRAFHDHILEEGALPLMILATRIHALYGIDTD